MLAVYLMATQIFESLHPNIPSTERVIMAAGAVVLLLPILLIPFGSGGLYVRRARMPLHTDDSVLSLGEEEGAAQPLLVHVVSTQQALQQRRQAELARAMPTLSPWACLSSVNFWLLFAIFAIISGAGLVFLNNLAQLWIALGGPPDGQVILIRQGRPACCTACCPSKELRRRCLLLLLPPARRAGLLPTCRHHACMCLHPPAACSACTTALAAC